MKLETRLQLLYSTLLAFTITSFILGVSLHRRWFKDLADIFLGIALQAMIIPMAWLALKNQGRLLSGRRLFWSRWMLVFIIALVVVGIAVFRVDRLRAATMHYAKQTH